MSTVQQSARQLKDLVHSLDRGGFLDYRSVELVLTQLLQSTSNEQSRRAQITSGVVPSLVDLLALEVQWSQSPGHRGQFDHDSQFIRQQIGKLLTNLTFKSADCKNLLCTNESFVASVVFLISRFPTLVRDYGDLIRNISWNCNKECWQCLYPTVRPLAIVSIDVCHRMSNSPFSESRSSNNSVATDDKTLKAVYSALWNLALTSAKCREAMCSVNKFLNYLIKWLLEFENHMIFIEQVVGLSKCLVDQIYKFSTPKLREEYVMGLMNMVASQAAQPNIVLISNILQALCLCIKNKNDEVTNTAFYKTNRFKFDLRALSKKQELDQKTRDRIHNLLEHVSFCNGIFQSRVQQSPLATPTYLNSPSYLTHTYIPMPSPYINAPASRPLMPVTSFQSPMFSTIRSGTTFHRNQPLTNSNSINTTPTSQDSSGLPSSADSKLGLHSRKHEDLKSSGYSETSMGSENFPAHHQRTQNPRLAYTNEYAEPKKQAFIRNLPPTTTQNRQQWTSPTNSDDLSSLYENAMVINGNFPPSTSQQIHVNPNSEIYQNYYQNEEQFSPQQEGAGESFYLNMDSNQYASQDSLFCNGRSSQHPSMTSIAIMPFCQSEGISPKSVNLSPINEDDIDESDSASQRGILIEKNASINTTPCTTMTNNSTISARQKDSTSLKPINIPEFFAQNQQHENEGFNQTF